MDPNSMNYETSDSEDERHRGGYQPVLAEQFKNSPSARAARTSAAWPNDGVNVYTNDLFTDGDVLGGPSNQQERMQGPGSPASNRPGTAQKMQQAKSGLAARRQERMQATVIERNETISRGVNSPGGAPNSPSISRLAQPTDSGARNFSPGGRTGAGGDTYNGLQLSYDPTEELDAPTRPINTSRQPQQQQQQQLQQQPSLPMAPTLDLSDLNTFLKQPGPKASPVMCYIVRDKGSAKMYPKYNLFLEEGKKFLLAARKRKKQTTSNYIISLDYEDLGRDSDNFFGKLRSNFVGTDFTIFDNGDKDRRNADGSGQGRRELGCIAYGYNVLGTRGPRKMTACIPAVDANGTPLFRPTSETDTLIDRVKGERMLDDLLIMYNKPPRWNEELNAYCLNFNGRVTEASVKNFQLVTDDNQNYVILQFGKIGRNTFTMDYQWPMSALQAFAICLSSFDSKLACE